LCAAPHFASGANEAFPSLRSLLFEEKELNLPVVRKAARVYDAGVVQHQQIAGVQKRGQVSECPMLDPLFVAVQNHHARVLAIRQWPGRDQFFWQRVIVI